MAEAEGTVGNPQSEDEALDGTLDGEGQEVEKEGEEVEAEEAEEVETETEETEEEAEEKPPTLDDFEEEEPEDVDVPESVSLTIKQIKAAHPEFAKILKEFPYVKAAMFKSEKYEEFFPSVKDAEEAVERIQVYSLFDNEISRGNLGPLVTALKKNNPQALEKIAEDFTELLGDTKLANLTGEPIVRAHLKAMLEEGKRLTASGNKNLELAARYTINYLYGKPDLPEGKLKARVETPEVSAELQALRNERSQNAQKTYEGIQQGIIDQIDSKLFDFVSKSIDPDKQMSKFTREAAAQKTHAKLLEKLKNNPAHMRRVAGLWSQIRGNFSTAQDVGPRIIRAFLGSAKPYLPELISKTRTEALGKSATEKRNPDTSLSGGGGGNGVGKSAGNLRGLTGKIDYSKTSENDLLDAALMGDSKKITLR